MDSFKKVRLLVLVMTAALITACGKTPSLTGTWATDCEQTTSGAAGKQTFTIENETDFVWTTTVYGDAGCASASFYSREVGTLKLGDGVAEQADTYKVDMTYAATYMAPRDDTALTGFNTENWCGLSNWTMNTEKDVSGKNCSSAAIPAANAIRYRIIRVTESDGKPVLYFGDSSGGYDGTTEDRRATSIKTSRTYRKQQ